MCRHGSGGGGGGGGEGEGGGGGGVKGAAEVEVEAGNQKEAKKPAQTKKQESWVSNRGPCSS